MKSLLKYLLQLLSPKYLKSLQTSALRLTSFLGTTLQDSQDISSSDQSNSTNYGAEIKSTFALETNSAISLVDILTDCPIPISWGHSETTLNKYIGVVLRPNQRLQVESLLSFENVWLRLSFAPVFHSYPTTTGIFRVTFIDHDKKATDLCSLYFQDTKSSFEWSDFEIDMKNFDGRSGYIQLSYELNLTEMTSKIVVENDFPVIISKLPIAPKKQLSLIEARTYRQLRIRNEVRHFSEVYDHQMYKTRTEKEIIASITHFSDLCIDNGVSTSPIFKSLLPATGESVYAFASRLLDHNLEIPTIDFAQRLLAKCEQKKSLRILSLCAGSARTEAGFDDFTKQSCEWTLQDLSEDLLLKARRQFSPSASVSLLIGDINEIHEVDQSWDIIMCVSGLHHVVELEKVTRFISNSLEESGEFWLIGEYVGKNGNRLHLEAQKAADVIFESLPSKYRHNHHTNQVDVALPRNDYSIDCFEGIRSEEIEPIVAREFIPVEISRNNSFLWRLVNLAYADNYDLGKMEDVQVIESMVKREIDHFKQYRDGTTLNARYRKAYRT